MSQKVRKIFQAADQQQTPFSSQQIQQQLQQILDSPDFDATKQQRAFLDFIVSQTLAGNGRSIKGYSVATQVFGRDGNFDQAIDPIVSIQANKLRRSLERYYLLSGKEDTILIEIPKGSYRPVFREQKPIAANRTSQYSKNQHTLCERSWPTLLIKPFQNLTNSPEKNYWGIGFATELATEINRFQWISVLQHGPEGLGKRSSDIGARFVVEGNIREDETGVKVIVNLIDTRTNKQLWSDTRRFDNDLPRLIEFQERVAIELGTIVAGEQGIISRTLSAESYNKPPGQLKTYDAILRYHEYNQTFSPKNFSKAFEALEQARTNEPECGQVWSFLARLYTVIYSLEIDGFDITDSENKALEYAEEGARLNPDDQGARGVLAFVRMLNNDISAAQRELKLAYELNPNSLFLMDEIGYLKTLLGEWEEGPALIRKAIKLNPYYKPIAHYALWVDSLRQQNFHNAYLETTGLRSPAIFWYPLAKASTLGLLYNIDEGKKFAEALMKLKPDFQERGRILIGRYVKFDDIAERIIEGLAAVGIEVR